jgi:hypothetical protein
MSNEIQPQRPGEGHTPALNALYTFEQMERLAEAVAKSGFIKGARTPDAALALMLVCQAQGRQLGEAITRFHVIEGVPSVKADVMLADYQARGGRHKWLETNNEVARAEFWHPQYHPERLIIEVTLKELIDNRVAMSWDEKKREWNMKTNYKRSPAAMLRARCQTQGIRAVDPGAIHGFYTPEEVSDFAEPIQAEARIASDDAPPGPSPAPSTAASATAASKGGIQDLPLPGFAGPGFDSRPYFRVVSDAAEAIDRELADLAVEKLGPDQRAYRPVSRVDHEFHRRLLLSAVNKQLAEGPPPQRMSDAIRDMDTVYRSHREWARTELADLVEAFRVSATALIVAAEASRPTEPETAPEPPWEAPQAPRAAEPSRASQPEPTPAPATEAAPSAAPQAAPATGPRYMVDGSIVTVDELYEMARRNGYSAKTPRTSEAVLVLRHKGHRVGQVKEEGE